MSMNEELKTARITNLSEFTILFISTLHLMAKSIANTETEKNLLKAFAGESQAF